MHHYIITRFSILDSPAKHGFRRNNSENYLFSKERLDFLPFMSMVQATTFPSIYPLSESTLSKLLAFGPSSVKGLFV